VEFLAKIVCKYNHFVRAQAMRHSWQIDSSRENAPYAVIMMLGEINVGYAHSSPHESN
jgi:hypothetical protein